MTTYRERLEAGVHAHKPEGTVEAMKLQLREQGLPVSGSKAELEARLAAAEEEE